MVESDKDLWIAQDFQWYGGALELMGNNEPEAILSGPYETGKTIAALCKLHSTLWHKPNVQALIIRQTYNSLVNSAIATFENKVLPFPSTHPDCPITAYGGKSPSWYDYPNGSRLYLGGMDRPGKFLSAEYDMIYVNQAEEISLNEWEILAGRATGRAGNLKKPQLFGDCNPSHPGHWIKKRSRIKLIPSRHEDNPALFDPVTGEITEQGTRTMMALDNLTGLRYQRGRLGLWVQAEGVVYDNFNEQYNVSASAEYNPALDVYWGVDDGYVYGDGPGSVNYHPRVILFGQKRNDGGWNIFDEYVQAGELPEKTLHNVTGLMNGIKVPNDDYEDSRFARYKLPLLACVDSSAAELRSRIGKCGIMHVGATHKVNEGIKVVRRYICDGQGVRMLHYHPRCVETIREHQSYRYDPKSSMVVAGEPKPLKTDDHTCDAERYMIWSGR